MKHFCLMLLIGATTVACNPDKSKRADPAKIRFTTTDDAELFFKNLRQQAYELQEMPAAKLNVYRHEDRTQEADYPLLQTAIVINWRQDEAYLLLEPNEHVNTEVPLQIEWRDSLKNTSGRYEFDFGNKEEHIRFAGELYGSLLDGHQLYYLRDSVALPFLENNNDREVFRISLLDFYRLTRNIK